MAGDEKRKYARIESRNLVTYVSKDQQGKELSHCIAMTRNVSPSGVLIETFQMINSEYIWLTTLDLEDNLIEIKGKVIYCKGIEGRRYEAGISFQAPLAECVQFATKLLHVYNTRRITFVKVAAASLTLPPGDLN